MSEQLKNSKHEALAVLIASGGSIKSDADHIGLSQSRCYTVASDPRFKRRVAELRQDATSKAVGRLSDAAASMVDVLQEIATDPANEPQHRIAAAKAVLGAFKPLSELAELRDRLAEIEAAVGSQRQKTAA